MLGPLQVLFICILINTASLLSVKNNDANLELRATSNGIKLVAKLGDQEKLTGTLWPNKDFSDYNCVGTENCKIGSATLNVTLLNDGYTISWETKNIDDKFVDCFDLPDDVNWYGGPERNEQDWPLEKMNINSSLPYVLRKDDNFAICERYWLNSKGAYIYIDEKVPLFVDQNVNYKNQVCFIASATQPYIGRSRNILEYTIILQDDPKSGHLHAINNYLGKPTDHPETRMFEHPIWTTWAKYKRNINDDVVISYAQSIRDHGFEAGQIEIDDKWEPCYGAQEFANTTFPKISETVQHLQNMDFKVSVWVHPFVDDACQENSKVGLEKGYFVRDPNNNTLATWWNGDRAHQIDFTNPEATEWYSARLRKLQKEYGIDAFKFDAGETDYGSQPTYYKDLDPEVVPNALSSSYIRNCAKFGKLIEVRSAWRTQDLPVFVRMIDKDSVWGLNNGLRTLVTTLLQMNMNGYTMVLPDMIGGNGYGQQPDTEIMIRWTQANTFMPAMQFSYLPWDFQPSNTTDIIRKFVNLHKDHLDDILKAMNESITNGVPVNPPIWWIAPDDPQALKCADQFLLGTDILVAPILDQGKTSRDIYLPKGIWIDGNDGSRHEGPATLKDFPAPIDVLPWFRISS